MTEIYPSILIISSAEDAHTTAVCNCLDKDEIPLILDFSQFGTKYVATVNNVGSDKNISIVGADGSRFNLDNVASIWWRRPQPLGNDQTINFPYDGHIREEKRQFLRSMLSCVNENAVWYNNFDSQRIAERKIFQLEVASRLGMTVPATCVTSNAEDAKAFISSCSKTIFKLFSGSEDFWQPTRVYKEEYGEHLESLSICPAIFQEYIYGTYDYRIVVLDGEIYSVRFDLKNSRYKADVRIDTSILPEQCQIPVNLEDKLRRFMDAMGLRYGAFDFREKENNGEFVFLEVNPSGQFLYLDVLAKTNIASAFASCLAKGGNPISKKIDIIDTIWTPKFTSNIPFSGLIPDQITHIGIEGN